MKKNILLLALCGLCVSAVAQQKEMQQVLELNKKNHALTTHFTEVSEIPTLKKKQTMAGMMYFDFSSHLAMIYEDPEGDYTQMSDDIFVTKKAGQRRHFNLKSERSPMLSFKNSLFHSMKGDVQAVADENDATIKVLKDKYISFQLDKRAQDKRQRHGIVTLTLHYDKTDGSIVSMQMVDAKGKITTYELQNKKLNGTIDPKVFDYGKSR